MLKIDFVYKLDQVLPAWPAKDRWTLDQISSATGASTPHLIQFFSEGLGQDLEVNSTVSGEDATKAQKLLKRRLEPEIAQREAEIEQRRSNATVAYDKLMDKVNMMQIDRQWHQAMRSLCYYMGHYEADVAPEIAIHVCSEIVRCGIKSGENIQEIGRWLKKGTEIGLSMFNKHGMEEALDLVDAYGEVFFSDDFSHPQGHPILASILTKLEEPATRFELWGEYKRLVEQLYSAED